MPAADHFARLGLPPRYRLDEAELEQRFRRLQSAIHPDRFATGSEVDRRLALKLAADGNEAYRILSHPTRRAAYLCALRGLAVADEGSAALSPEFLERQMALRESLEEVSAMLGRDAAAGAVALDRMQRALDAAIADGRERLAALLDDQGDVAGAAELVRELMFHDKLQQELRRVDPRPSGSREAP